MSIRASGPARDLSRAIRATALVIVVVLVVVAISITRRTERILVDRFNESHVVLARFAGEQLEEFLSGVARFLGSSAATMSAFPDDPEVDRLLLSGMVAQLQDHGTVEAVHVSPEGRVVSAARGDPASLGALVRDGLAGCDATAEMCLSGFLPGEAVGVAGDVLVASVGVPAEAAAATPAEERPTRAERGRVAVVIDWLTVGNVIAHTTTAMPNGFGWLVGADGSLLHHPDHPPQMRGNVRTPAAYCVNCHDGFDVALRMANGGSGSGEIADRGATRKLVAYAPVTVAGRKWSIAVSAPYDEVVATGRRHRNVVFAIKGVLVAVIVLLAFLLDTQNRRQIRALREADAAVMRLVESLEAEVRKRTDEATAAFGEVAVARAKHESLERLAVVGELASIVAHEVRNPLNALAISSQRVARLLRAEGTADLAKAREIVESQGYEIRRIDSFVQDYLRLARLPKSSTSRQNLEDLIKGTVRFIDVEKLRSTIKIELDLDPVARFAEVDQEQLRHVMLNLLMNAFQAMPGGGEVTVRTRREGSDIVITMSDTGTGIARENIASIFKPFFTTKENGTGLGLSICARMVEDHHGSIECDSEEGNGATFRIRIPIAQPGRPGAEGDGSGGGRRPDRA